MERGGILKSGCTHCLENNLSSRTRIILCVIMICLLNAIFITNIFEQRRQFPTINHMTSFKKPMDKLEISEFMPAETMLLKVINFLLNVV